jgi:hypothetical protein
MMLPHLLVSFRVPAVTRGTDSAIQPGASKALLTGVKGIHLGLLETPAVSGTGEGGVT